MTIHNRETVMKKNLGTTDRIIRVLAAVVIGILLLTGQIAGTLAWILGILAIVLILTSVVAFCPLYFISKISTLARGKAQP
jgi:amino acid transporter